MRGKTHSDKARNMKKENQEDWNLRFEIWDWEFEIWDLGHRLNGLGHGF
jgi:hypothetical protein